MKAIAFLSILCLVATLAYSQPADTDTKYPVVRKGVVGIQLRQRGALLSESFAGTSVDEKRWRIWHSNPNAVTFSQKNGRFTIQARNRIHYNGLWSLNPARFKDVTLVGRMNIRTKGPGRHSLLLHLCGGDMPLSPDHWVEVAMTDVDENQARFHVNAAIETGAYKERGKTITLPRQNDEGFLARLSLDGSRNVCTTEVRDTSGQWHQIVKPVPLNLRTTHCEVKMREGAGTDAEPTTSTGWFEQVRIYPRAVSNPVLVRLVMRNGQAPYYRVNGSWPPKIRIGDGRPRNLDELVVELWTADGATRVARVRSPHFAHYMLSLDHVRWDVFPVAAVVCVSCDGTSLGEAIIPLDGLDGLYPDDVYDVLLE
ncbi:MAG: hypothetical protein ACYTAS_09165 [Planctomycetota bacterium]|jgi:hypothetical protein